MGRIATQGFACPNRTGMYYRITDALDQALIGDGAEGKVERREILRESGLPHDVQHTPLLPSG